ncbi:MAG: S8 family serine peptidase [Nitrospinae bacterium]|nr:S8 family serine peptidase [Nitrospinota bacterium]MBL7019680.1 S8 family serine peptidase [Nitrospinaceae bacterium]
MVETKSVAKWALVLLTTLATPAWGQSDMVNNPVRDNLVDAANSYIFVFDSSKVSAREVPDHANAMTQRAGGQLRFVYQSALRGFSATMSRNAAEQLASRNPNIAYFEPNAVVWAIGRGPGSNKKPSNPGNGGGGGGEIEPAQVVPAGIQRVGGPVTVDGSYRAWVIDTGIDSDHADLNVGQGANFVFRGKSTTEDGNGHGTHVAGTIAAIDNAIGVAGVAAGATVIPIRVLDKSGSGTVDGVIAGVDYVSANATPGECANLSLGVAGHIESLHNAILSAADSGVKFAIAAGNDGLDMTVVENGLLINNFEPADVEHANVYTVSAIDSTNTFASFSNYGIPPVDFVAPGVNILSTKKGGGVTTKSGTSMAAPHVCGVLTLGANPVANGFVNDRKGTAYPVAHTNP